SIIERSAHVEDIAKSETAIAQIFLYPRQLQLESWARHGALSQCNCHLSLTGSFFFFSSIAVQTIGSGISNLLAVATTFTGSGNLYCQWEL
nr:hypothetical protein [Tanacetum cinerariifolium]